MKKLMGLLFEEDDDEEEVVDEYASQEVAKVEPKKHAKVTNEEKIEPIAVAPSKPKEEKVLTEGVVGSDGLSVPTTKTEVVVETAPKKMGIDIAELTGESVKEKKEEVSNEPVQTVRRKVVADTPKAGYEFTPVISPIFGVDEKDADAVIPTNPKKIKANDSKIGTIISPMYGIDKDAEPDTISTKATTSVVEEETESAIPDLSLDELISGNDSDYSSKSFFDNEDLDEHDEESDKKVIENRNMSFFGDDDLD